MAFRLFAALVMAGLSASCAQQPYTDPWGMPSVPVMVPFNGEPWVGTWSPTAWYQSANQHQPFQTPNSLPPGALTIPGR